MTRKFDELNASPIVANNAMNRERQLRGTNSYEKDLRFRIVDFIRERLRDGRFVMWLDLCAGAGKALIEAGREFKGTRFVAHGVDLVSYFDEIPEDLRKHVMFHEGSLPEWRPRTQHRFDLITCCHGLHYVGDKLLTIRKFATYLKDDGLMLAHLDLNNVQLSDDTSLERMLRHEGFTYNRRSRVLRREGFISPHFPYRYEGADDTVGPNYTGQPAVTSHYSRFGARECGEPAPLHPRFTVPPKANSCELDKYHSGPHRVGRKVW